VKCARPGRSIEPSSLPAAYGPTNPLSRQYVNAQRPHALRRYANNALMAPACIGVNEPDLLAYFHFAYLLIIPPDGS